MVWENFNDANLNKCAFCGNTADHYNTTEQAYYCNQCYQEFCNGVDGEPLAEDEEYEYDYGPKYWFDNPEDKAEGGL